MANAAKPTNAIRMRKYCFFMISPWHVWSLLLITAAASFLWRERRLAPVATIILKTCTLVRRAGGRSVAELLVNTA
jgi:hypothetical protein